MNKFLITGGAGFIGYHMVNYLSKKTDNEIHIVDNLFRGKPDSDFRLSLRKQNIKFIEADLTDPNCYTIFATNKYDYIYHFAGIVGVKNAVDNPDKVLYVNTVSILNLLEWIKVNQKQLKRFLFASTSEVYTGTQKHYKVDIPTDEKVNLCLDDIASARTSYALSKIFGECSCFNYFKLYKIPITIVRYHNIYGPRMGYNHVIPELMLKARKNKRYLDVYSVKHTRAFCYISDAIEATFKLITAKDSLGQIFNVGNSYEEITIENLAKKIIRIVNPKLKIKPSCEETGSPARRCPDIDKLRQTIKFKPKVYLDEGLKLTWDWYKNSGTYL